jgi:hypothetical protein
MDFLYITFDDGPSYTRLYLETPVKWVIQGPFPTIYPTNNMGEENIYIPRHRKRLRELPKKLKDTKLKWHDFSSRHMNYFDT